MIVTDQNVVNSKFAICDSGTTLFSVATYNSGVLIKWGGLSRQIRLDPSVNVIDANGRQVISAGVVISSDGSASDSSSLSRAIQDFYAHDGNLTIPDYVDSVLVAGAIPSSAAIAVAHTAPFYSDYYNGAYDVPELLKRVTISNRASPLIVFGSFEHDIEVIPKPTQSTVVISGANLTISQSQNAYGTFFIGRSLQFQDGQGSNFGLQLNAPKLFAPKDGSYLQLAGTYKLTSDTTILDVDGTPIVLNGKRV